MDNLDVIFYYNFYEDLRNANLNTPRKLIHHYETYGKNEGRYINAKHFLKSINFNYENYKYNYDDLKNLNNEELEKHYIEYGRYEYRQFLEKIEKKYDNNFIEPEDSNIDIKIPYKIVKIIENPYFENNQLIAHLHCYNIDKFEEIYREYINNIIKYFNVYVTFSKGNNIPDYNIEILKIKNNGADIGGKICLLAYLYKNDISYSNILFLHSKSDKLTRDKYFNPFISNIEQINYICSIIGNYDLLYPNLILCGDWNRKEGYTINNYYYEKYLKLMKYQNLTSEFIEGNCLIASKKLINAIFPIKYLEMFYKNLNTEDTYDLNWVKHQYKLFNYSDDEIFKIYKKEKYLGNHLTITDQTVISDYDFIFNNEPVDIKNKFLKDGAYEHLWERLWLNVCLNIDGNKKCINKIHYKVNLKYNFDTNLYKFLNNISSKNDLDTIYDLQNNLKEHEFYSLKQILENLPLNFDIKKYSSNNKLINMNKYEIINHFCIKNKKDNELKWINSINNFNNIKMFVHVFPQFHEIKENDNFWGKGFTEWSNVRKTFQIHDKHLPIHPNSDIGFYNLLDYNTRNRWNNYANKSDIFGFIFCHFWFSKGIIMNKGIDKMLEDGMPNKPWFFNWINENWTKRWDGGNNEILMDINLNLDKCEEHFNCILKYFKSKNYYKIDNKPVLGIYRPNEIPDVYIKKFIKFSLQNGFSGIIFIKTLNNNMPNNLNLNTDEFCEFEFEYPPNYSGTLVNSKINNDKLNFYRKIENLDNSNNYDIHKHYIALSNTKKNKKKLIRGIMPCWDNLPRHTSLNSNFHILIGSNSFIFYLILLKQFIKLREEEGEYMVINSLNEWAEQCVLEPSIQNQYSYLEALELAKKTDLDLIDLKLLNNLISF